MTTPEETYADWFVWAKRNLANDSAVCHAAAAAATDVEQRGGSRTEAVAAARHSLTTGAHLAPPAPVELDRRSYAEWFDWARRELGGGREQQHAAARAAIGALRSGAGANAAAAAARSAAGHDSPAPAPAVPSAPDTAAPASMVPVPAYAAPPAPPGQWQGAPPGAIAVPAHNPYGGFWRRLAAYLIDSILLSVVLGFVAAVIGFLYGVWLGTHGATAPSQAQIQPVIEIPIYGFTIIAAWLYYTLLESSSWQGTLGKLALGLRVADLEGNRISWGRATGRYFAKILLGSLCFATWWTVPFSERKQGLHDMIARTVVLRRPA